MKIEERRVSDIKPYGANPRMNDQAVDAVAASIREFGFRQPIVVDESGVIIVGHTRWKAAQKLGLESVPVHVATGLTQAKIKAYRIADNKVAELAEWDFDLLPLELKDLQGLDFNLDLLGFGSEQLEKILGAGIHGNAGLTDPDAVPDPPDDPITQPGDLWILGNHRLLCGDSSKAEDVDRLLDGARVDLVFMDPPYGHNNNNNGDLIHRVEVALGKKGKAQPARPILSDSPEEASRLFSAAVDQCARVLDDGCCCCCCGGGGPDPQFARWSMELDRKIGFKMAVVWDKTGLGLGWHYRRCYELVLVAQKPGKSGRWFGGNDIPNVIRDIPKIIPRANQHPTEKPVALPERFIRYHSRAGENVLDLFGGSGSTLIAAERTGRRAYLMELDRLYCDMIRTRWETFTGKKGERCATSSKSEPAGVRAGASSTGVETGTARSRASGARRRGRSTASASRGK